MAYAIVCRTGGNNAIGVKTPDKNTIAIRTTVAGGIACGMSLNGADSNKPKAENMDEEMAIPIMNRGRFCRGENGIIIAA